MKNCLIMLASLVLFFTVGNAQQGWVSQTSPLGAQGYGEIQFVSPTEGWIVARNGLLIHTTNFGATWSVDTASGTDTVFVLNDPSRSMSFVNDVTGWMIGSLGSTSASKGAILYNTTNSGTSWSKQLLAPWSMGLFVQFVDANNGWAVVANGTGLNNIAGGAVLHTTNGGASWDSLPDPPQGITYFIDANNGWSFGGDTINYVWHTTNGGTNWSNQITDSSSGGFNAMQFVDANNGWVVGGSGKIFHTTNGGTNWTRITNTGNNSGHKAVFFLNADVGWVGGRQYDENQGQGIILHTTDAGESWTIQNTPAQEGIFSIYFIDANNGWLTGDQGALAKTTTGGSTSVRESGSSLPGHFDLMQNYPNPFNPSTVISYQLSTVSKVTLKVYDVLGREIETLVDERQSVGTHSVSFDASNVPSGVYFYQLQAGGAAQTKKLVVIK